MRVRFFSAQRPAYNPTSIYVLHEAFGGGPQFMPLEGGNMEGPIYLFCVDASIDVERICEDHGFKYSLRPRFMEIDSALYNKNYIASVCYDGVNDYKLSIVR
jgi:hypothetical protein